MVAALSAWHQQHEEAAASVERVRSLPAHALVEAYSVLTRLPAGLAIPPVDAVDALARHFPDGPLSIPQRGRMKILERLARAGVSGGATYDGVVGLEAREHARTLLTLDTRAIRTYERLGVQFTVVG